MHAKFLKLSYMKNCAKHDVLVYLGFPNAHCAPKKKMLSTNPLEHHDAEIKRGTDALPTSAPSSMSVLL